MRRRNFIKAALISIAALLLPPPLKARSVNITRVWQIKHSVFKSHYNSNLDNALRRLLRHVRLQNASQLHIAISEKAWKECGKGYIYNNMTFEGIPLNVKHYHKDEVAISIWGSIEST